MKYAELRQTTFGEVLAELMEARGLEVSPFQVGKLGEQSGLDGWKLINRMANADAEDTGHLGGLAKVLNLSEAEKIELSFAYTFERRAGEVRA